MTIEEVKEKTTGKKVDIATSASLNKFIKSTALRDITPIYGQH